jgi:hypothetical protein
MQRAATYARISTDFQNDRSVEDQHALCRTFAEREGLDLSRIDAAPIAHLRGLSFEGQGAFPTQG